MSEPKLEKRIRKITFSVSDEEANLITEAADNIGLTRSQFVKMEVLKMVKGYSIFGDGRRYHCRHGKGGELNKKYEEFLESLKKKLE